LKPLCEFTDRTAPHVSPSRCFFLVLVVSSVDFPQFEYCSHSNGGKDRTNDDLS